MGYSIKNEPLLKKILWIDNFLGGATAITGLLCFTTLATVLGLTTSFILSLAIVNLLYSILSFILALQKPTSIRLLRPLIYANWLWTVISVLMVFAYFNKTTSLGTLFLLIQPIVVGGLAYIEHRQIVSVKAV
jgi:hypothetical protein